MVQLFVKYWIDVTCYLALTGFSFNCNQNGVPKLHIKTGLTKFGLTVTLFPADPKVKNKDVNIKS
jgi:hypothetical protein